MFNSKRELVDDMSATAATAQVITWTSNEPTVSYAYTVAQGDIITSTETGICIATMNAQITALIAEVLGLRTAVDS
jgi:hypothetical protein